MKTHELKTWPGFFQPTWDGLKTFELRKDDRGFQAGDILILREYIKPTDTYTGRMIEAEVIYLLGNAWLAKEYVCMVIKIKGKVGHGEKDILPDFCDKCGQHITRPAEEPPCKE